MPLSLAAHLDLLVCPVCHGSLTLAGEVVICTSCHRRYPIVDGLPVLIASRAISDDEVSPSVSNSASNSD